MGQERQEGSGGGGGVGGPGDFAADDEVVGAGGDCFGGSGDAFLIAMFCAWGADAGGDEDCTGGSGGTEAGDFEGGADEAVDVCFDAWTRVGKRYDCSMTRAKIAISLPKDQLEKVHREIRAGRAKSVSGYISGVLAEHERRESLRALLNDLVEVHGRPAVKDIEWAERALARRRG